MIAYLFKEWLFFFNISKIGGIISQDNHHLLTLNGHGSHIIIKTFEQAIKIKLDIVTLPSRTLTHSQAP